MMGYFAFAKANLYITTAPNSQKCCQSDVRAKMSQLNFKKSLTIMIVHTSNFVTHINQSQ